MEEYTRKHEGCPKLLDLIPKNGEYSVRIEDKRSHCHSEEKKLELRLGPPDGDWTNNSKTMSKSDEESSLSFGCFSNMTAFAASTTTLAAINPISGIKRGFIESVKDHVFSAPKASFLQLHAKGAEELQAAGEKKAFSPPSVSTVVPSSNSAQKRSAPARVVGWPPVRSCRRNLASGSNLKPNPVSQNGVSNKICSEKPIENGQKGLFVKINMDGVPIGRKVDLQAYDTYEKLSSAVDELFKGLLAAQGGEMKIKGEGKNVISGLLDGSGEYTLVYEDNEGDRMLVGDVPWHMFVSTVKRLRVLKTSEISSLCRESRQRKALS